MQPDIRIRMLLIILIVISFITLGGSALAQSPLPAPTDTPDTLSERDKIIGSDIVARLIVFVIVAILSAIGTYLFKPRLDDWLERHKQARQAQEEHRQAAEQAQRHRQITDERAQKYLENLVAELRDLRILEMTKPLDLERTYVRLQVREEARRYPRAEEEVELARVERDPNEWLTLGHKWRQERLQAALSPEEALRQQHRCVVLGDPGAGKTTMLKYLALCSAQGKLDDLPALPLFVSLHRFTRSGFGSLLDFAAHDLEKRYGFPGALPYLEERLEAGDVLLLFDGLDEVNVGQTEAEAETHYSRTVEQINDLATRYRQVPIVVTSRLAGWRGGLAAGFHKLEALDLGTDEIRQFVENWFHDKPDKADGLQRELGRSARIATMAANPLLLALICIVYQKDLELPERRASVYERCVHVLLVEWDSGREIRRVRAFTTDHKRDLLEAVAWHFHRLGRRYFPQDELLAVIGEFLPKIGLPATDNGPLLDEITAQHGLLKEQALGWYGFLHLTLQEYFAAREAHQENRLDAVLANLHRPWWEEVTLLLASMGDVAPLLRSILEGPEDIFHANLCLAGRCLVGRPRVNDPALYSGILDQLRARLRLAKLPLEAERLARVLAELGGAENNDLMMEMLRDENVRRFVRWSIADVLGSQGERQVILHLLKLLNDEKIDMGVRASIADALGVRGERQAASFLLELLKDDKVDKLVRMSIAAALGVLGDRQVVPHLLELLEDEKADEYVWGSIVVAPETLEEHEVILFTTELLWDDKDEYVWWSITDALRALGERQVAPLLLELLGDEKVDADLRMRIAVALVGALKERQVIPRLLEPLWDDEADMSVQMSIAAALGTMGEREVALLLLELLEDEKVDQDVRRSITNALVGALKEHEAAPFLLKLPWDVEVDSSVRMSIADALGALGERQVAPRLLDLLADEKVDEYVRMSIADALGALGERQVAPRLLELLGDEKVDEYVRMSIACALGALGERQVAPRLLELLGDVKVGPEIRKRSAAALVGALGEHEMALRLLEILGDEMVDPDVRQQVAAALGVLRECQAVPLLLELLRSERDEFVRMNIAAALGAQGERQVVPLLLKFLGDEMVDEYIRMRSADALGATGECQVAPRLLELLADEKADDFLQQSIAHALGALGDNAEIARDMTALLQRTADRELKVAIYTALYQVSQRAGVRVLQNGEVVPLGGGRTGEEMRASP